MTVLSMGRPAPEMFSSDPPRGDSITVKTPALVIALLAGLGGCTLELVDQPVCGNGVTEAGEQCDDGNTDNTDTCGNNCAVDDHIYSCHDGVLDPGEECDDGNDDDLDGCWECILARCGDGHLEQPPEQCDDGNTISGDGCNADCTYDHPPVCGDGFAEIASGEVCDDGNQQPGDGCSSDCRSTEICGNGILDPIAGETCDDGNHLPDDGCEADCRLSTLCGNHAREAGEECDTGPAPSATCDPDCTLPLCGDGYVNTAVGEHCDDGNVANGDGCSHDCQPE
jgi:cysteine-rich repeat protein